MITLAVGVIQCYCCCPWCVIVLAPSSDVAYTPNFPRIISVKTLFIPQYVFNALTSLLTVILLFCNVVSWLLFFLCWCWCWCASLHLSKQMWVDQNMPAGEMRKLIIHGSKTEVEAAVKEAKILLHAAPGNNPPPPAPRAGKMGPPEVRRKRAVLAQASHEQEKIPTSHYEHHFQDPDRGGGYT